KSLQEIPYGQKITYKDQASSMNRPRAVRAVAKANGQNHLAIIIPCHRVVGSQGSLTDYSGGLERKRWLLNLEANQHETHQ
ncbi:MAG TPA: XRE family transcriptional regulator, partial [Bdellovibrionales bacterium]|nr:XRE family transcriptional regulator [Bdellovibrionales bacterium]